MSAGHDLPFPTPSATSYGTSGNGSKHPNKATKGRPSLETMARRDFWPTATAGDARASGNRNLEGSKAHPGTSLTDAVNGGQRPRWPTPHGFGDDGHGNELSMAARVAGGLSDSERTIGRMNWPTPRAEDSQQTGAHRGVPDTLTSAVRLWPTPKSSPSGPDYARTGREGSGGDDLATAVAREVYPIPAASMHDMWTVEQQRLSGQTREAMKEAGEPFVAKKTGSLNPDWVEWLMGWPLGWTSLDPLPPERFDSWLRLDFWWLYDPAEDQTNPVPRVDVGIKHRVDRLTAIGNGQVPDCVETAWRLLGERE